MGGLGQLREAGLPGEMLRVCENALKSIKLSGDTQKVAAVTATAVAMAIRLPAVPRPAVARLRSDSNSQSVSRLACFPNLWNFTSKGTRLCLTRPRMSMLSIPPVFVRAR